MRTRGQILEGKTALHKGGTLFSSQDDWKDAQGDEIEVAGILPGDDRESAILATLIKESSTGIIRGKDTTTGVALIEECRMGN